MSKPNSKKTGQPKRTTPAGVWVRFAIIGALWLWLCGMVLVSRPLTLWTLFVIAASGIVVFVPLYKKYVRDGKR
ncbi:MAG: hypothetical protein K2G94_08275 [Muribaculaceae bacterium]|nr:hypothetical protein [Muribaculaceae bacterium]MDE6509749.1 hypothetical protein [Muribaculaceae bacterium]